MWSFLRNTLSMSVCRGDIFLARNNSKKRKEKKYFRRVYKIYLNVIISVDGRLNILWDCKNLWILNFFFVHKSILNHTCMLFCKTLSYVGRFKSFTAQNLFNLIWPQFTKKEKSFLKRKRMLKAEASQQNLSNERIE